MNLIKMQYVQIFHILLVIVENIMLSIIILDVIISVGYRVKSKRVDDKVSCELIERGKINEKSINNRLNWSIR